MCREGDSCLTWILVFKPRENYRHNAITVYKTLAYMGYRFICPNTLMFVLPCGFYQLLLHGLWMDKNARVSARRLHGWKMPDEMPADEFKQYLANLENFAYGQ